MKFYLDTIEQIYNKEQEGTYIEYGNRTAKADETAALIEYYEKLKNVSNALGKTHVYLDARIINSVGGVLKHDSLGSYMSDTPAPEPEPTPDPEEAES